MRTSLTLLALLSAVPTIAVALPTSGSYASGSASGSASGYVSGSLSGSTYGSGHGSSYGSGSGSSTPTPDGSAPDLSNDGASTLYKAKNLAGKFSPTDYVPIPADGCLDLSQLYGAWENQASSLVVQDGYKCDFYTELACPKASPPLCLTASGKKLVKQTLPAAYDKKIKSVKCEKVKATSVKPKPAPQSSPKPAAPKQPTYGSPSSSY